ncbi:hypothetical protein [Blastopirellula marina]|uniref:Uncharacterized protein n=1 Tax=Blastopirellula marina TaxID=124 RepID=A0A2S8GSP8_9BACT|nr:hypothetical protein [Blastopirellula marina]PQO36505.1 hypothetical protein C5Y98_12460 [Blastopirellula marina]PQO47456.1 hypothetical protein C5Y93_05275 [Blastopirellula marina]PTL44343.1 hypothetical protein C5Y97_12470 [Blastopirellula marina]
MTWLAIGGVVCLGFVVLFVGAVTLLFVYASYSEKATEKRLRENGKPVLGVLVMANSQFLQEQSIASAPALVIISHEPPTPDLAAAMRDVASDLFELYTAEDSKIASLSPPEQKMAELIKNDSYREGRRNRVSLEMTQGRVLYMTDIWLQRDRLPDHVGASRVLACLATGQEEGEVMALPFGEEAAQRIYAAVGV